MELRLEGWLRRETCLIALIAALHGACGVALAATAAHVQSSPLLATASEFLMIHAAAGLALAALASALAAPDRGLTFACLALQGGVTLFCADMAARALGPGKLFPFAAPIGGSLTILAWLALAAWAALRFAKASRKAS